MKKPPFSLVHLLIGKSIIEALFVSALVVVYFLDVFPHFHGWGEVHPQAISGWAVNSRNPSERVEVQLFIDDTFVARTIAAETAPKAVAGGWATDEWHGFTIAMSKIGPGRHQKRSCTRCTVAGKEQERLCSYLGTSYILKSAQTAP